MTVFVTQLAEKNIVDRMGNVIGTQPTFDISSAESFGDIEVMFPKGSPSSMTKNVTQILTQWLRNYNDDDFLLGLGDPTASMLACAVACKFNNGKVNVLVWDRQQRLYLPMSYEL